MGRTRPGRFYPIPHGGGDIELGDRCLSDLGLRGVGAQIGELGWAHHECAIRDARGEDLSGGNQITDMDSYLPVKSRSPTP